MVEHLRQHEGIPVKREDKTTVTLEVGSTQGLRGGMRATKQPKQGTWTLEVASTGSHSGRASVQADQLRAMAAAMDEAERTVDL